MTCYAVSIKLEISIANLKL